MQKINRFAAFSAKFRLLLGDNRGFHSSPRIAKYVLQDNLDDCYLVLRLNKDCEDHEVREAYLKLAKEYHPDGSSKTADHRKFAQLQTAYKAVLQHRQNMKDAKGEDNFSSIFADGEETDRDMRHTAPQHRQYLEYEGFGFGTPGQRQRQYEQYKVNRASENVFQYRISHATAKYENSLVAKDKQEARKHRLRNAMDRLVEDLIADSMAKGDFDNLAGKGKPLKHDFSTYNPVLDHTTFHLNRILIENGYAPEWVMLEKEIRRDLDTAREVLLHARKIAGPEPIPSTCAQAWQKSCDNFIEAVEKVNTLINKFNLITPSVHQQLIPKDPSKEVNKMIDYYNALVESGDIASYKPADIEYRPLDMRDSVSIKQVFDEIKAVFKMFRRSEVNKV